VREQLYFYSEVRDKIIELTINPCGCHPLDVMKMWGYRFGESVSISFRNKKDLNNFIESYRKAYLELEYGGPE